MWLWLSVLVWPSVCVLGEQQTLRNVFTQYQSMNQLQSMVQQYQQYFKDPTILGNFVYGHSPPPLCPA